MFRRSRRCQSVSYVFDTCLSSHPKRSPQAPAMLLETSLGMALDPARAAARRPLAPPPPKTLPWRQNLRVSWKEMEIKQVCTHLASAEAVAAVPTLGSGSRHRIRVYGSAPARSAGNKPASIALCAWALAVVLAALI